MSELRYRHSLVCLRRDLRLHDHIALHAALMQSERVSLCFILDPRQYQEYAWQSRPGLAFMLASLHALDDELAEYGSGLLIRQGQAHEALSAMFASGLYDALYLHHDYTPFSRQRDHAIQTACDRAGIPLHRFHDALLHTPGTILTANGKPYQVFTAFYQRAVKNTINMPQPLQHTEKLSPLTPEQRMHHRQCLTQIASAPSLVRAGRDGAMDVLAGLGRCHRYSSERDIPALDAGSHLSVHLKFGILSVREAYQAIALSLSPDHPLLRQLHWRDFFYHIAFHYPAVFGSAFHRRYNAIRWSNNPDHFAAWCNGTTGFPMVDAGMRQLRETGRMHNRVRMITASFLVKDLLIDWRWGEAWFARHLLDYDPAINNGNWQWAASTGCDAQPWFRIFNPSLQQKRFDPELLYCQHWIPDLKDARAYPAPIVDHAVQTQRTKQLFREINQQEHDHAPQ